MNDGGFSTKTHRATNYTTMQFIKPQLLRTTVLILFFEFLLIGIFVISCTDIGSQTEPNAEQVKSQISKTTL